MNKLVKNWKLILTKSYSCLSIIANVLMALSISGLATLGVISHVVAIPLLVGLAISFGLVGLIGRVVDQELDSIDQPDRGQDQ